MATSSITKNFVISGDEQAEKFANAIEESYQESITGSKGAPAVRYREVHGPAELKKFMEKWEKMHEK